MPAEIDEEIGLQRRGGSCSPAALGAVSGAAFSIRRSTLPETMRGSEPTASKWAGTM